MNKIEVKLVMLPYEKLAIIERLNLAFRLTQSGDKIKCMNDVNDLPRSNEKYISKVMEYYHSTPQKNASISVLIVGVSRRFLAQITKHHEAVIVSTSLQYTKYAIDANYCVPYEILDTEEEKSFLEACENMYNIYDLFSDKVGHDAAAYLLPEATRCSVLITATVPVWQHIIKQRICKRNTTEMRYVILRILKMFNEEFKEFFPVTHIYPCCNEMKLSCKNPYDQTLNPEDILKNEFSKLC